MADPRPHAGNASETGHVCYFQMIQGGMACACGETITASPKTDALSRWVKATQAAMRDEGISSDHAARVINRVVYGDPLGPTAVYKLDEDGQAVSVTVSAPAASPAAHILASAVRELNERMQRVNGR